MMCGPETGYAFADQLLRFHYRFVEPALQLWPRQAASVS